MSHYLKRITWLAATLFACLAITQTAQAASFDCAKAKSKVEKLICGDEELSKLDDEMSAAYKAALQDEKQSASIKQAQKRWVRERNGCKDAECVRRVYETWIQKLSSINVYTPSGSRASISRTKQLPTKNEAEKAQRVKTILRNYPLNFSAENSYGLLFDPDLPGEERQRLKIDTQYQSQTEKFCTTFYNAMQQADDTIHYIEPVVHTDNPNHPMLKQYHSCADAEDRPNWRGVGEGIYEFIDQIGDRAFKQYRLDLDDNPKNGLEEYLYAELDVKQTLAITPGYNRIDFERCEFMDGVSVYQDQQLHTGRHRNNYNAMIRYRGEYYIFDLSDPFGNDSPRYWLNLYRYSSSQRAFVASAACIFRH